MSAVCSSVPWTAIIGTAGAVIGAAIGFWGSVLVARSTNTAANDRLQLEQMEANRTRFHQLRVELYEKLFLAIQDLRESIAAVLPHAHEITEDLVQEFIDSFTGNLKRIKLSAQMVGLVASGPTRQAATALLEAILALPMYGLKSRSDFEALNRELDKAEAAFSDTARVELLPPEEAEAVPLRGTPHNAT